MPDSSASPALRAAVEVFRELGWADAALADAPGLPLGTSEQRSRALKGLRSGNLRTSSEAWSRHEVAAEREREEDLLALFTVAVGASVPRSLAVLGSELDIDADVLAAVVSRRGREFAQGFVTAAYKGDRHVWDFPATVRRLVIELDLPVPKSRWYSWQWTQAVGRELGHPAYDGQGELPAATQRRFVEHVENAVELQTDTEFLPGIIADGVRRSMMGRDRAVEIAFDALESATKPTSRRDWAALLVDGLAVSDQDLLAHAELLTQAMATGPAQLVGAFAPRLIGVLPEDQLGDVLLIGLSAQTKKAKLAVLRAATERGTLTPEAAADIAPLLQEWVAGRDKQLASAAEALLAISPTGGGVSPDDGAISTENPPQDWWRPTPPLWQVPRLELGPATPDAVTDAASVLAQRSDVGLPDLAEERFLALATALAYADPDVARDTLAGVAADPRGVAMTDVAHWIQGDNSETDHDLAYPQAPLWARSAMISPHLGSLPCLLSTPSWVDLRIAPADLVDRLRQYVDAGVSVVEADLYLALLRLDVSEATAADRAALGDLVVPIAARGAAGFDEDAASITLAYLDDPIRPPIGDEPLEAPGSIRALPPRIEAMEQDRDNEWTYPSGRGVAVFPTFPELAVELTGSLDGKSGLVLQQLVRRASPLPPAYAARLLEAQHQARPGALAEARVALLQAWERGLLPPGSIDLGPSPRAIASVAAVLLEVSEDGLASLAWDVLDRITRAAAEARKVPSGTAEALEALLTLLPVARAAVQSSIAPPSVLDLPGVRELAGRSGSSKAVATAAEIAAQLPAAGRT